MIYGVVDVGSNSIRLSITRCENGKTTELMSKKEMAGLAGYVQDGVLAPAGIEKAGLILAGFREILDRFGVDKYGAFATQSLRGILNSEQAAATIAQKSGLPLEIISGDEEARLDFIGVKNTLELCDGVLVDIGGGSTELVAFSDKTPDRLVSLPIGSLGLYAKYAEGLFPKKRERAQMKDAVRERLKKLRWPSGNTELICGIGGTARACQKLSHELLGASISDTSFPAKNAKKLLDIMERDVEGCRAVLRVVPERTFSILPGLVILSETVRYFGAKTLTVSRSGVRDGYLIDRFL